MRVEDHWNTVTPTHRTEEAAMKRCLQIAFWLGMTYTLMVIWTSVVSAQECKERAVITSAADVYERPARYTTGAGWQGARIRTLPANAQVYICSSQSVDFGFSSKLWYQVSFKVGKMWSYGWVLEDNIKRWASHLRHEVGEGRWTVVAVALAAENRSAAPEWNLGSALPPGPTGPTESGASLSGGASEASFSDLGVLYAPLFVALLLGMIAKAAVDYLDTGHGGYAIRDHCRSAFIGVLVSPIVFSAF
jgi:hypothetical protein